ncbi:hypothetical protein WJX81_001442 [Elliptochloris bilobata]|uniref:Patatin n=1 Tax=Elliptochloris bilobata TaxID=381761 RepID=A0AAW1S056_9CHLO
MFSRRILGGQPDGFVIKLGFQLSTLDRLQFETAQVSWTAGEPDAVVLGRLRNASVVQGLAEERVHVVLQAAEPERAGAAVSAATFGLPEDSVRVRLEVALIPPQVRSIELARSAGSGSAPPALLEALLHEVELGGVTRLRCGEGAAPPWEPRLLGRLLGLRSLNLSACGLVALPPGLGQLTNLRELRVAGNRLAALPRELGALAKLHRLVADNNLLTALPLELRHCSELREVAFENNRLATPVLDLRSLAQLRALQLFGNPLEFLPELSPCTALRYLSLANVRMRADACFTQWDVEFAAAATFSRASRLAPLFGLVFRRSSCQHPLLAGALGKIAEDPAACAEIVREVGAIQQLILMALSENEVVVEQACKTIGLLGRHNSLTSLEIIEGDVLSAMMRLITSTKHKNQLAGLQVVAGLALASEASAVKLLTPDMLKALNAAVRSGADDVKAAALETMGNLAFARPNRAVFLACEGLRDWLARLAEAQLGVVAPRVRMAATRHLAVLGEGEAVRRAVGRPLLAGRGVRVLSMDGGGMKGIAMIRLLRQLEQRTGRRIHELFDLVAGTSTGGILAVALALKHFTLEECEDIYRKLGQRVFSKQAPAAGGAPAAEEPGWRDSLYRESCQFEAAGCIGSSMIDTACLDTPKCFVVATLVSMTPAEPFIFRNYEHPAASQRLAEQVCAPPGSSLHQVWQAVRASSAAPYYLDDFKCGADRFQDGAASANNPAALALAEARVLWPDVPIECLVSLGSGTVPSARREKSVSAYLDTGSVLIESACSTDRIHSALATALPLVPGLAYFRFCAADSRCGIALDEIDPEQWAQLEAATDEYIVHIDAELAAAAALLSSGRDPPAPDAASLCLGARRGVLLVEAPRPGAQEQRGYVEAVGAAVAALRQCAERLQLATAPPAASESPKAAAAAAGAVAELDAGSADAGPDAYSRSLAASEAEARPASGDAAVDGQAAMSTGLAAAVQAAPAAALAAAQALAEAAGLGAGTRPPAPAAATTHPGPPVRPAAATEGLAGALAGGRGKLGVVHLAMHSDAAGAVAAWGSQLEAVAEPSEAASALVRELGGDPPATTLAALCAGGAPLPAADNSTLALLSAQTQVVHGRVATALLLERVAPAAWLTAEQVEAMAALWEAQIVTAACELPAPLVAALLRAGAKAVVCRRCHDKDTGSLSPDAAVAFFKAFFAELLAGRPIAAALGAGGRAAPVLAGRYAAARLQDGALQWTLGGDG